LALWIPALNIRKAELPTGAANEELENTQTAIKTWFETLLKPQNVH
jgi:hypothetical protein